MATEPQKITFKGILRERNTWLVFVIGFAAIIFFYQFSSLYIILPDNFTFSAIASDGWYPASSPQEQLRPWTNGDAALRFSNLGYPLGNDSYELSINPGRGYDDKGNPISPVTVTISMGGQILGYIDTGKPYANNKIAVPYALLRENGPDPTIRIASPTFTPLGDTRKLGVQLGSGELLHHSLFSPTIPPLLLIIGVPLYYMMCAIAMRRWPSKWGGFLLNLSATTVLILGVGIFRVFFIYMFLVAFVTLLVLLVFSWRRDIAAWWSSRQQRPSDA